MIQILIKYLYFGFQSKETLIYYLISTVYCVTVQDYILICADFMKMSDIFRTAPTGQRFIFHRSGRTVHQLDKNLLEICLNDVKSIL